MGSFYGNVTLCGTDIEALRAVAPRPTLAYAEGEDVVVFAAADEVGVPESGASLSAALGCVAFSARVHDDDIFTYEVHNSGRLIVSGAIPDPEEVFADADPPPGGGGGDPRALVEAVGRGDVDATSSSPARDIRPR